MGLGVALAVALPVAFVSVLDVALDVAFGVAFPGFLVVALAVWLDDGRRVGLGEGVSVGKAGKGCASSE